MNKKTVSFIALSLIAFNLDCMSTSKYAGVFTRAFKQINSIKYGNWGSRPYEYAWAADLISVEGKKVIDLGVGLPSQYNWYQYAVNKLKPSFYTGIDHDGRIKSELIQEENYEIKYMSMANLEYADKFFDVAYCISTFEHIPYDIFIKSIQEAHRVLKDDGLLVITLDEEWDKNQPSNHGNGWNLLEKSLIEKGLFTRKNRSFGLPEFLHLIKDYFVLYLDDAVLEEDTIVSRSSNVAYYDRKDKDNAILNSGAAVNSCVSYALLKKVNS